MPNYAQAAIQIRQKKEREAKRLERELRLSTDYTALLLQPPVQVGGGGGGGRGSIVGRTNFISATMFNIVNEPHVQ